MYLETAVESRELTWKKVKRVKDGGGVVNLVNFDLDDRLA
jgi:hypothetical protein